jgi:hypothetical protein
MPASFWRWPQKSLLIEEEAKWEADGKIKRKVDLFAAAPARQAGGPWHPGYGRGRGNPHGQRSAPLEQPHPREELRQD